MNRITKIVRRLLAGGVLAGLLLSGAVVAEGSASAATTPVLYSANKPPLVGVPASLELRLRERRLALLHQPDLEVVGQRLGLGNRQGLDPEGRVQPEL